jgi:hypothetical protein
VDQQKYEWGKKYARLHLQFWKKEDVLTLIFFVDYHKEKALDSGSFTSLGIAAQAWEWVLEKGYEAVI